MGGRDSWQDGWRRLRGASAQEATPGDRAAELAKKLANPVAALISVPLQYNYDEYGGANDGASKSVLNVQPIVPLSIGEDWNLIIRTIVPIVDQEDFPAAEMNESGLGDVVQSFFFSPRRRWAGGFSPPGRWASIRRHPRTCWAASSGARGRRRWR
jgi:hypothetical protein